MATAEQNTLLALQLFGAPAEQFANQQRTYTNALMQLALRDREEQAARERFGMQSAQAERMAELQGKREIARDSARDRRDEERIDAADKKQLRAAIATAYPKYAAEANRLGEKVRPITEFEESWEGLGDIQAEMARLEQARVSRDQEAASDVAVGELDSVVKERQRVKSELEALQKPTAQDLEFAKERAIAAVQQAIGRGDFTKIKPDSEKARRGLTALQRGDTAESAALLGDDVLSAYRSTYQSALQAAPNFKARMQAVEIKGRELQQINQLADRISSDLRRASATSNPLATKLVQRRTALQELMAPSEARQPRPFGEITPPPPTRTPNEVDKVIQLLQRGATPQPQPAQPGTLPSFFPKAPAMTDDQLRELIGPAPSVLGR